MKTFHIYTLSDPRDNTVKYVGCTINPKSRLQAHILTRDTIKKSLWMDELQALSLKPVMTVISTRQTVDDAAQEEIRVYELHNNGSLVCDNPNVLHYKYKTDNLDDSAETQHPKQIRIEADLYEKAQKKAKTLGLNFSSYVRLLIANDTK